MHTQKEKKNKTKQNKQTNKKTKKTKTTTKKKNKAEQSTVAVSVLVKYIHSHLGFSWFDDPPP